VEITKDDIIGVLSEPAIYNISFWVGPIHIEPDDYETVRDMVEFGDIDVVPKASLSTDEYVPQQNTLYTKHRGSASTVDARAALFHECTHAVVDKNAVVVTRLVGEVAAFLAQTTFTLFYVPDWEAPSLRTPVNNLARELIKTANTYELHKGAGFGARISDSDVETLVNLVKGHPQYSDISKTEMAVEDGIANKSGRMRFRQRSAPENLTPTRIIAFEEYPMYTDGSFVDALQDYRKARQKADKDAIFKEFEMTFARIPPDKADATYKRLASRLASDRVSSLFNDVIPKADIATLLAALRRPR
jgi:hypothetical protein